MAEKGGSMLAGREGGASAKGLLGLWVPGCPPGWELGIHVQP